MSNINNGGPAFPTLLQEGNMALSEGDLTLRDYFAAQLAPVLLAYDLAQPLEKVMGHDWVAEQAMRQADAMLAARAQHGKSFSMNPKDFEDECAAMQEGGA